MCHVDVTGVHLISIPAPPRGATAAGRHDGGAGSISIPAPPRGATVFGRVKGRNVDISIPAPPRGRRTLGIFCRILISFQFTPLREGRQYYFAKFSRFFYFNSRPSARGDTVTSAVFVVGTFQFTPLREGRRHQHFVARHRNISIHAPPRGATCFRIRSKPQRFISIHAPPRGATGTNLTGVTYADVFQFTPLREGRRFFFQRLFAPSAFQFTPLREGRRQKICNFCKFFVQPLQISMA